MNNKFKFKKNGKKNEFNQDDDTFLDNFSDEVNGHYQDVTEDLTIQDIPVRCPAKEIYGKHSKDRTSSCKGIKAKSNPSGSIKESDEKNDQIKTLQEKLSQTNARLYEYKNTCLLLRQEINKAQKIISDEIGEHATIANLSNHRSEWKGRSLQIQQLQHKINQLQNRLNEYERSSRSSSASFDLRTSSSKNSEVKERRKAAENLEKELQQSKIALENNKKNLEASKARIKILENDLNNTKRDLYYSNEKKSHDDQLIKALNGQVRAVENRYRDKEVDVKNDRDKFQRENVELKNELNAVKYQVGQLRKRLGERETEMEFIKLKDNENKLEPNLENHLCLDQASTNNQCINEPKNIEEPNEYIILTLVAEAERKRLLDLIAILNQRLDKERSDTDHLSKLYCHEKQKNSKLENKLQQLELKRPTSKINSGYRKKISKSLSNFSSSKEQLDLEQTQYKLEFLEEECLALKTRLTTLNQEKHHDFVMYKQMLEQSKKIFQNACRDNLTCERNSTAVTI